MASTGSVIARDDTLLGICFALGEDFGFNPLFLRIPLGAIVLWSLPAALGVYAALGILVAFSRWLVPNPAPVDESRRGAADRADEPREELPLAA